MATTKPTGGLAFPVVEPGAPDRQCPFVLDYGMTLRDYFAAQALAVIPGDTATPDDLARDAYRIADAMIAEREK